jgi:hypothetical protein
VPVLDILRAASEAVREGCLPDEEGEEEDADDDEELENPNLSATRNQPKVSDRDAGPLENHTVEESGTNA